MLNRRVFNAVVGSIPFVGMNFKEQKNELAEYILNKISEQHTIEEIRAVEIEWLHYSVKGPTWFYFHLKDRWNTKVWAIIPQEFDTGLDNLIEVSKIIEDNGIECFLMFVDRGYQKTDKIVYNEVLG